jgi:hypothetical protein
MMIKLCITMTAAKRAFANPGFDCQTASWVV